LSAGQTSRAGHNSSTPSQTCVRKYTGLPSCSTTARGKVSWFLLVSFAMPVVIAAVLRKEVRW